MNLSHLLHKDLILWDESIKDINALYERVASLISNKYSIDNQIILDAFIKRDELGYTVFPDMSVIPHGRIDNFDDLIIVIVKTQKPILISGNPADIFYCILTTNSGSNHYLRTLASFAKLSMDHGKEVRQCHNSHDFIKLIENCNYELDNAIQIKDIIENQVHTVQLNDTIEYAADLMKKHNVIFLPVTDEHGTYLGKIDVLDVIKIVYPEYMNLISDLSFLKNLRAFEEYQDEEKKRKVKDLYSQAKTKIINQNEYAIEVGYILAKNNWHHITVVDDDHKVVAVLSTRSFLNNILRA
jgi:PTS system nitrogen regulatory IIA component